MNKKILITGSNGTIGTRLVEKLLEANIYNLVGIDKKKNLWNTELDQITILGDLTDKSFLKKIPKDIELIIHLAANARVYDLIKNPKLALENVESLFNTLEFARKNGIKKIMFASSREVYGNSQGIQSEDQVKIKNCENPYTFSKTSGEALIHSYNLSYGIEFIILRFGNVYGMYDEKNRIIPQFIKLCNQNLPLTIFGKGKILDFVYIDDVVWALIKSINNFELLKGGTLNISSGKGTSLLDIANLIKKHSNQGSEILLKDTRGGEVTNSILDIALAKEKLGFFPQTGIEEGIKNTVEWYARNSKN